MSKPNGREVVIELDDLDLLDESQILSDIEKDSEKGLSFRPDVPSLSRDIYGRTLPTGTSDNPSEREGLGD